MRTILSLWTLVAALACLAGCAGSKGFGPNHATSAGSAPMAPEPAYDSMAEISAISSDGDYGGDDMRRAEVSKSSPREPAPQSAPPPPPPPGGSSAPAKESKPAEGASGVAVARLPMLIYTANLQMQVIEAAAALAHVEALARELGGFLARRDDTTITIRVPVARFDEALRRAEELGDVLHRSVSTEDVTEQYADLEIRLRNLRAIRDRLQKLLEKAEKVEESILIERELGRVNGELARIEGRMKLLRDQAAYSTLTVVVRERPRESLAGTKPRLPVDWLDRLGLPRLLGL